MLTKRELLVFLYLYNKYIFLLAKISPLFLRISIIGGHLCQKTPLDKFAKLLENPSPNLSVEVYTENKDEHKPVKKHKERRMTLAKLSTRVDDLSTTVDDLSTTVDDLSTTVNNLSTTVNNLSTTVNNLVMTVNSLAKEMRNGFKQVNSRIDNLEKDVNARIDRIDARLDYNGLKKLPESR